MNIKRFLIACKFLTIFPFGNNVETSEEDLARSMVFFPLVGFAIGLILWILHGSLSVFFPNSLVNTFSLLCLVVMSRGLHLDGFADVIDGFAGGMNKERRIEIMKDSTVGVFGISGIVFLLLLKLVSLNNLSNEMNRAVLFVMPVAGRLSIVFMAYLGDYIRDKNGIGKPFSSFITNKEFWIASVTGAVLSIIFMGNTGLMIMFGILVFVVLFEKYSRNMIDGITGDVLGASCEVSELIVLLFAVFMDNDIVLNAVGGVWL